MVDYILFDGPISFFYISATMVTISMTITTVLKKITTAVIMVTLMVILQTIIQMVIPIPTNTGMLMLKQMVRMAKEKHNKHHR